MRDDNIVRLFTHQFRRATSGKIYRKRISQPDFAKVMRKHSERFQFIPESTTKAKSEIVCQPRFGIPILGNRSQHPLDPAIQIAGIDVEDLQALAALLKQSRETIKDLRFFLEGYQWLELLDN